MADPIYPTPLQRIEQLFVAHLRANVKLAEIDVVPASDRDVRVQPLHCFVLCESADPITSTGPYYRAVVRIVVASNIDDTRNEERQVYADACRAQLATAATPETDARLCGWAIQRHYEDSDGQATGDVFRLLAGAEIATG